MPKTARPIAKPVALSSESIVASEDHRADATRQPSADLRDAPWASAGRPTRGPRSAASEHRDRHRQQLEARLEGVEPEHDLEVDRQHEERAHQDQLLRDERGQAGPQRGRSPASSMSSSGSSAARLAPLLPPRRTSRAAPRPPRIRNGTTEKPSGVISRPLIVGAPCGWIQPQVLLWRIAEHDEAEAARGQRRADDVELRRVHGLGLGCIRFRNSRITATITTSPTNT